MCDIDNIRFPNLSSYNEEELKNYKYLLYKKYLILSTIYEIPKLNIDEPLKITQIKYYTYINLIQEKKIDS